MRTASVLADATAPIVRLLDPVETRVGSDEVARARAFAAPLVIGRELPTGEGVLAHADGVAAILASIGAAPTLCAAACLVHAADELGDPDAVLTPLFGESQAALVAHARKLGALQRTAQGARLSPAERTQQVERVRKMLLAFSQDLRVVLLRLASRLQTLRFFAATKLPCPEDLAAEAMQVFAPLANRLGIWQIKWELEDLAFRFLDPVQYRTIANLLDERRADREARVAAMRQSLADDLAAHGLQVTVQGRPKHLYSIWKKMKKKGLGFAEVLDVVALRVIAADVAACYAVLGRVHERFRAIPGELDDYIARPKANGYRSLHTVVEADDGSAVEIQIRTAEMHEHAEYGLSAHWAYKEADAARASVTASGSFEANVAQARLVVLRQLLAWERDLAGDGGEATTAADDVASRVGFDDRIYVFTPQAALVELAAGATPIDFAYAVHTQLGHRCRGAKVDGAIVPLNTALKSGQVVEVIAAKAGGPSLDWLNPELGYLQSARSKSKVRAWFNAQAQEATLARGREAVEKVLQREGRTALKHAELATRLGLRSADALYEVVGKDELSLKSIEALLRPAPAPKSDADEIALRPSRSHRDGGVLVVGVGSLLTSLARCCRPAPPDPIAGYVTRGKGVAVHRVGCSNLRELVARSGERVIDVAWGAPDSAHPVLYPVDVAVEANDRPGLLRDVSEVLAREKINVTGVRSQSVRDGAGGTAFMTFTVEVPDATRLAAALAQVCRVAGVRSARRR